MYFYCALCIASHFQLKDLEWSSKYFLFENYHLLFINFLISKQVFKGLYDNASNSVHVYAYLAILTAIRDVCKLAVKELTSWVCFAD